MTVALGGLLIFRSVAEPIIVVMSAGSSCY